MACEEFLSDELVADLLKKEAGDTSIRFSGHGLHGALPSRPRLIAPKPNTRFLRNIIRETDSHNASLLAREAEQSRSRLKALKHGAQRSGPPDGRYHNFARAPRDEDTGRSKRRRVSASEGDEPERSHRPRAHKERDSRTRERKDGRHSEHRSRHGRRPSSEEHEDRDRFTSCERRERRSEIRSHRSRHRQPVRSESEEDRHARRKRRRSRSRSRTPPRKTSKHHTYHRSRRRRRARSAPSSNGSEAGDEGRKGTITLPRNRETTSWPQLYKEQDSDPLESIIGPPPPPPKLKVITRGRGTFAASGIDTHFSSTYDPALDVHPNSESEDDWDQALEALRDRQRWRQQGAERLRSAGFTQEEIEKWEKGGTKMEEDVRWAKRGEGREWDRGKVVSVEGDVDVKPEWGRLKGT